MAWAGTAHICGEPSPSPGTLCCSHGAAQTHDACAVCLSSSTPPSLPSTVPRADSDHKSSLAATQELSPSLFTQLHGSFRGLTPPLTEDWVCLWSSDTSRLTQQGWQDELSWSHVL